MKPRSVIFGAITALAIGIGVNVISTGTIAWLQPESKWASSHWEGERGHSDDAPETRLWELRIHRTLGAVSIARRATVSPERTSPYWERFAGGQAVRLLDTPYWSGAALPPSNDDFTDPAAPGLPWVVETAFGWPFVSMKYEYRYRWMGVGFSGNLFFFDELSGGLALSDVENLNHPNDWRETLHVLPYRVVWPGFLFNAAAFGGVLWLIWFAARWTRRLSRLRRGCCPACGYPIGVSHTCTECGVPVKPSSSDGGRSAIRTFRPSDR